KLLDPQGNASDAGGRFAIDGDKLVVARDNAFDFEQEPVHAITIRATDGAGNQFHKSVAISVGDDTDFFSTVSAVLPANATIVQLWELDQGGFVITWLEATSGHRRWFARQVDDSGATIDPATPDRLLRDFPASGPLLLGVDDNGVAVFVDDQGPSSTNSSPDIISWVDALTGSEIRSKSIGQSWNFGVTADGTLLTATRATSYELDDGYLKYEISKDQDRVSRGSDFFERDLATTQLMVVEKTSPGGVQQFSASSVNSEREDASGSLV